MFLIKSPFNNASSNAALEAYLFENKKDSEFLLFYMNNKSIVIGKHQNAYAEVNLPFVLKNQIEVVRRLSGGGAVYHDQGNINISWIINNLDSSKLIDFERFLMPLKDFLISLGLNPEIGKRQALFIDNFKISGNAAHVFKNRILFHATLLFNCNLNDLSHSLTPLCTDYHSKSLKSHTSPCINLNKLINISQNDFYALLQTFLSEVFTCMSTYQLNIDDFLDIEHLVKTKFSKWSWNYAHNANYDFCKTSVLPNNQDIKVSLEVKNGIIQKAQLSMKSNLDVIKKIEIQLIGLKHTKEDISAILNEDKAYGDLFYLLEQIDYVFF